MRKSSIQGNWCCFQLRGKKKNRNQFIIPSEPTRPWIIRQWRMLEVSETGETDTEGLWLPPYCTRGVSRAQHGRTQVAYRALSKGKEHSWWCKIKAWSVPSTWVPGGRSCPEGEAQACVPGPWRTQLSTQQHIPMSKLPDKEWPRRRVNNAQSHQGRMPVAQSRLRSRIVHHTHTSIASAVE